MYFNIFKLKFILANEIIMKTNKEIKAINIWIMYFYFNVQD